MGNVNDLTDHLGSEVRKYRYDAFGGVFTQLWNPYNQVGLTGKSYDIKASLMDYSALWYSPVNGRFTTQDTWTGIPFLPQTLNRYAYVSNNQINLTDPTGHSQCDIGDDGNMICLPSRPSDDWSDDGGSSSGGGTPPYDTWEPPLPDDGGDPEPAPTREQTWTQKVLRFLTASGRQDLERDILTYGLDYIPFVGNVKSGYEAVTGVDLVTGRELNAVERSFAIVGIFGGGVAKAGGKAAIKTGELLYEEGRAVERISLSAERTISEGTGDAPKGWKVGDSINAPTSSGNYPSWSTVKSRYWKNVANDAEVGEYSAENMARMSKGKAPIHDELGVSKELHHINGRNATDPHNINNLQEVWPWEHADIDPFRHYNGPRP